MGDWPSLVAQLGYGGNPQGLVDFQQDWNALNKAGIMWPPVGLQLPETGLIDPATHDRLRDLAGQIPPKQYAYIVGQAWRKLCRVRKHPQQAPQQPARAPLNKPARARLSKPHRKAGRGPT